MSFGDFYSHSHGPTSAPPFQRTPTPFTPSRHSPLTPRRDHQAIDQNHAPLSPPQSPPSLLKFAEINRKHKPNPMIMSKDDVREKRRNIFLNKLKNAREQSRVQARGGEAEMMRLILVSEQRRWQANLDRVAASIPTIEEETECQLLRDAENIGYSELVEAQDKELEAILSQLDITNDNMHQYQSQSSSHQNQQPVVVCDACGEQDSMVPIEGVHVCFCCGWTLE